MSRQPNAPALPALATAALLSLAAASVGAAEVALVGLFPGKAVLMVDGQGPFTVAAGERRDGVRVISVDGAGAVVEHDGRRERLVVGAAPTRTESVAGARVILAPDARGHYVAAGNVNGTAVRFLVDTGATAVTLSTDVARRAGIDPAQGRPVSVTTANGKVVGRQVRLDRVTFGDITLHQVDAVIQDGLGEVALLGMTFLARTDLRHEGGRLVLIKRY